MPYPRCNGMVLYSIFILVYHSPSPGFISPLNVPSGYIVWHRKQAERISFRCVTTTLHIIYILYIHLYIYTLILQYIHFGKSLYRIIYIICTYVCYYKIENKNRGRILHSGPLQGDIGFHTGPSRVAWSSLCTMFIYGE